MPTDQDLLALIIDGRLKGERDRLERAKIVNDFYEGIDPGYETGLGCDGSPRHIRRANLLTWAVNRLTQHLYPPGPDRQVTHPTLTPEVLAAVNSFLQGVYSRSTVNENFRAADRWSTTSQVAAIEVYATGREDAPVALQTRAGDSVVVFPSERDALVPAAVAVIDDQPDGRRLLTLWTPTHWYRLRTKVRNAKGEDAWDFDYDGDQFYGENPYGQLPFVLVHYDVPSRLPLSGCPGPLLYALNRTLDRGRSEIGEGLRKVSNPIFIREGAAAVGGLARPGPGANLILPDLSGSGEGGEHGKAYYLSPDLGFASTCWDDLQRELNLGLRLHDIPVEAFSVLEGQAKSGRALVAETLPLLSRARARRPQFETYEKDLARLTLLVGAVNLEANGRDAAPLRAALDGGDLAVRWPKTDELLLDPERDTRDAQRLRDGLTSRVELVMERFDLDEEAAWARVQRTAKYLQLEAGVGLVAPTLAPVVADEPGLESA